VLPKLGSIVKDGEESVLIPLACLERKFKGTKEVHDGSQWRETVESLSTVGSSEAVKEKKEISVAHQRLLPGKGKK